MRRQLGAFDSSAEIASAVDGRLTWLHPAHSSNPDFPANAHGRLIGIRQLGAAKLDRPVRSTVRR
jgi:hypothetical protein